MIYLYVADTYNIWEEAEWVFLVCSFIACSSLFAPYFLRYLKTLVSSGYYTFWVVQTDLIFFPIPTGYVVSDTGENGTEPLEYYEYLFTAKSRDGVGDLSGITGVVLCVVLILMAACSMPFVRRSGHFEVGWQIVGVKLYLGLLYPGSKLKLLSHRTYIFHV